MGSRAIQRRVNPTLRRWLPFLLLLLAAACTCGKKPPTKTTLKNEGEPCTTDDVCVTGLCDAPAGFAPVCVRKCATVCNADEVCTQLTPNRFACQPDKRRLCQGCELDADCPYPSDRCIVVNQEKVCGRDCAFDQACPGGYRCVNAVGVDGAPKVQQCTPVNASCACLARGDFQQPCQNKNDFGICNGIKQCNLVDNTVACDAKVPAAETCNGLDDDCNELVDDGLPTITCGVGECARTVSSCSGGGPATCVPGDAGVELCNGLDDDCDGVIDNGFPTSADVNNCGACLHVCALPHATPTCSGGQCLIQTCDVGYDNCNGTASDGCEVQLATDPLHCGNCATVCSSQNATASCSGGTCHFTCNPGFVDLNNDPSDGCEYACTFTSATDLPDLAFTDANCDGIDGEVANGIFVAPPPLGVDLNDGSRLTPKATLSAGVSAAVAGNKRDVYVAKGTYAEPLELLGVATLNVAGGYDPVTWKRAQANTVTMSGGNPALKIEGSNNVLVQVLHFQGGDGGTTEPSAYGAWVKESQGVRLESLDLRAGNGAPGADGPVVSPATPGDPGGSGAKGCVSDPDPYSLCSLWFGHDPRPAAGGGGPGACGFSGGAGGQPSHWAAVIPSGDPGLAAPIASGAGGSGVPATVTPSGAPYFGGAGGAGTAGANGAGATTTGTFDLTGFVPKAGHVGVGGTTGTAGGGGGGGAGGLTRLLGSIGRTCEAWGSAGGGGGGGGCGGNPGEGGKGGGASIGLFILNSNVTAQSLVVHTGNGGTGGAGASGGTGGLGGAGGVSLTWSDQGDATPGGNGGKGGNGGPGGHGGGGAGGSVYGLVRNAASTWNPISGMSYTLGAVGAAGTSPGQPGVAGTSSIQLTF
jgi:hypothetical protein